MTFAHLMEEDKEFFESWLDNLASESRSMQMQEMEMQNEQESRRAEHCGDEDVCGRSGTPVVDVCAA